MKNLSLALSLVLPVPGLAHAEAGVQATCEQHIVSRPRMTPEDWPERARGRDVSAHVVVSYRLDGSGKAQDMAVVESNAKPRQLFDKTTLNLLSRTGFAEGVREDSCIYVRTYEARKRTPR